MGQACQDWIFGRCCFALESPGGNVENGIMRWHQLYRMEDKQMMQNIGSYKYARR